MSDIVTRLRDRAYSGLPDRLLEEAADEIERLRGSTVEQRFCKPPVAGSTPAAGCLRDTFAAAALTGLIANGDYSVESTPLLAFRMADAMVRERANHQAAPDSSTNHDAAPAAKATVDWYVRRAAADGDSDGTDKPAPRPSEGTGNTPVTEPMPKEKLAEVSVAEPVAWATLFCGSPLVVSRFKQICDDEAHYQGDVATVIPLYRSPTLTDEEREAVEGAIAAEHQRGAWRWAVTLRGLLERLK